jgi:prepilin-type N-terminal cleavage/methylation domain-containing protein
MSRTRSAFTLVELSIVLVILGLLVGGVLAGQSLIRAAELRAVATEYRNYQTAFSAFKDKYFAFPGDMNNAVKFWGAAAGGTADGYDATCASVTTAATGTETCNGNGNGLMGDLSGAAGQSGFYEFWRAWQQLGNAGLIEGRYSGVSGPGTSYDAVAGVNAPRSKFSGNIWTLWSLGAGTWTGVSYFHFNYGNLLYYGGDSSTNMNYTSAMKAEEAFNIDTKIDDGKPNTGRILSHPNADRPNCINVAETEYLLSDTTIGCNLIFITGF